MLKWTDFHGQVVVLDFWATWCSPCIESVPHLNALVIEFEDKPVKFVSITYEPESLVKAFLQESEKAIKSLERIVLVACGTSWHAALVAKYWLEEWVGIPVEVDIGSEFRYRTLLLNNKVLTLSISQSGETADTLAGIKLASQLGSKVITICNVVGSTMTREADATLYTHAGPEIGVASTKAFTSQLAALFLFASYLAQVRKTLPCN